MPAVYDGARYRTKNHVFKVKSSALKPSPYAASPCDQVDCAVTVAGFIGLLNPFDFASTGLTSSLAIADHVANLLN